MCWTILLPPARGKVGMGASACGRALHPHPDPPPSQGEGSLCANLIWSDLGGHPSLYPAEDVISDPLRRKRHILIDTFGLTLRRVVTWLASQTSG